MSAGAFVRSKYQMSSPANTVVPIRVQPETLTLECDSVENEAPAGDINDGWPSARVSGGRRGTGIFARTCSFVFSDAVPPGYKAGSVITLPCLTVAFANAVGPSKTGTYTVGGTSYDIEFTGRARGEVVR
jgi:hypothetical protein